METLAYLHLAEEYENPEEKELVFLHNNAEMFNALKDLKVSGKTTVALLGVASTVWAFGLSNAAQAIYLTIGSTGPDVEDVQSELAALGYFDDSLPLGYYGGITADAVAEFQADEGLGVDGVVGDRTYAAMFGPGIGLPGGGTVRFGDSGSTVSELQRLLAEAGYFSGPVTGYFGSVTESAVIDFQSDQGIGADGIAGPQTFAALDEFLEVNPPGVPSFGTLREGDEGAAVTELQANLRELGYFSAQPTGYYGTVTVNAVANLQADYGISDDGIFGPETRRLLNDLLSGA